MKKIIILLYIFFMAISGYSKSHLNDYASLVSTFIGTKGKVGKDGLASGFTFFGATYPFGMIQLTPTHFAPQKGIVVNQISGAGCPHMGNFPVLPINGKLNSSPNDMESFYSFPEIIKAEAGYMNIKYKENIQCEGTVSKRSGILRFKYPDNSEEGSIIIGSGVNSTFINNAHISITSPTTCEGYAEGGEFCGYHTKYRIYFAAEFSRPAIKSGTWINNDLKKDRLQIGGKNSGAFFTFDTSIHKTVEYKVAISYVSINNALENLKKDNAGRSFEHVLEDTHTQWNRYLSKIEINTGSYDRRVQFYTHLYHSFIHPSIFNDINGEYIGADFNIHKVEEGRDYYSAFSGWDTYRTQSQLLAILCPKESSDMAQSLIEFAKQSGGYGRWILANIETGIMHGDPIPIIISNTYAYGSRDFDIISAYEYMKRGALIPNTYSQNVEVRPGLKTYMEKGIENASLCLEYTSADYAIGEFASSAIKNTKEADYFFQRSKNWKNLYDPSTKWLRSRYPHNMQWKNSDHDWREATKENYFWMVPYDLTALIDTIGGKKKAEQRLDSLFLRIDASYDEHYFAAGNEPDFQVPWIYNWVDKPYKTSAIISRILREAYDSTASGLPGNDDCGTMGAWYVFASIGMYPMIPGKAGFSINMPQFDDIKIHLKNGILRIKGGKDSTYIKKMYINDKKYNSTWIDWDKISNGGEIIYKTQKSPDKKWGIK